MASRSQPGPKMRKVEPNLPLVGSGKTHLLTRIEEELGRSNRIAVAKSLAVDKRRTSLPSLIEAMFYDLTPGCHAALNCKTIFWVQSKVYML